MKVVLALFLVVALISCSEAIKCYVCIDCSEPSGEYDCGSTFTGCAKAEAEGIVVRSCSVSDSDECTAEEVGGIEGTYCNCKGDLCNGEETTTDSNNSAVTTTVSMFALLAPLLAVKLFN